MTTPMFGRGEELVPPSGVSASYTRKPSPGGVSTRSGSASQGPSRQSSPQRHRSPSPGEGCYGPDGMELPGFEQRGYEMPEGEMGWFRAEGYNRLQQGMIGMQCFHAICAAVDNLHMQGLCKQRRWTNDPDAFPDLGLGIAPFPPHDDQLYIPWPWKPPPKEPEEVNVSANPFLTHKGGTVKGGDVGKDPFLTDHEYYVHAAETNDETTNNDLEDFKTERFRPPPQPWTRLIDFCLGGNARGACVVFEERKDVYFLGRVYQGQLENAYFVEALNAISLRPQLVRNLFLACDIERSVYSLRLFRNGTWVRVEIDDYVPTAGFDVGAEAGAPFCCRSEHFPRVLWPSLIEKAYAKTCTVRVPGIEAEQHDLNTGGWEALGGGGRVEEALADLTGGVAGAFHTRDVSPDRLFIYIHELQRDCLFVCRVNLRVATEQGVALNPCNTHIVNRAAHCKGGCYIQVFTPSVGFGDGGLSLVVPDELTRQFPETAKDGFFWLSVYDFHNIFGTIFECRLTNSPDVGLPGMPPPRLPNVLLPPIGDHPLYFEHIFANAGLVSRRNMPEFTVLLPSRRCEVVATVEQCDNRITQLGWPREDHQAILLKVYENVQGNAFRDAIICKSNWMPIRDSMVCFKSDVGGLYKIVAEVPVENVPCHRLIFRCYVSVPDVQVSASTAIRQHYLVRTMGPTSATKWSLVGCEPNWRMESFGRRVPYPLDCLDEDLDALRCRAAGVDGKCTLM